MNKNTPVGRKVPLKSSGLVRELAEFMLEGVQTHPDWCESLASVLVGMMMDKSRYMANNLGTVRGNLFFIYVGASGLSFKTIPLVRAVRPMLDALTSTVNADVLKEEGMTIEQLRGSLSQLGKADGNEKKTKTWSTEKRRLEEIESRLVDFTTLQVFTSESLTSHLGKFPQGMICGDEYTKMFKGANKKDYLTDNMEDLSRLYDCDMEKKGTISRGVEYPKDAYICFASATTYYLLTLMTSDFFLQGTGNRIMWILDDELTMVDVEEEAVKGKFFWDPKREEEFKGKMDSIVKKLLAIRYLPTGLIAPDIVAAANLDRYRLRMYNEAVELFNEDLINKDANLIARLAQNAMKLALVHCVGRAAEDGYESVKEYSDDPTNKLEITDEDAQWAIDKTQRHYVYYQKMWEIASRLHGGVIHDLDAEYVKIKVFIRKIEGTPENVEASYKSPVYGGKHRVLGWMLSAHTKWKGTDLQQVIDSMIKSGQLKIGTHKTTREVVQYYTLPGEVEETSELPQATTGYQLPANNVK